MKTCVECGGEHDQSGARIDCINHWKKRAVQAENALLVQTVYGTPMRLELLRWLEQQIITPENIGNIRRQCFLPWDSSWNALVRDETAAREKNAQILPATA